MLELGFIAYFLSLISIACNIWLYVEIKELKQERQLANKKLNQLAKRVVPIVRPKGHWG